MGTLSQVLLYPGVTLFRRFFISKWALYPKMGTLSQVLLYPGVTLSRRFFISKWALYPKMGTLFQNAYFIPGVTSSCRYFIPGYSIWNLQMILFKTVLTKWKWSRLNPEDLWQNPDDSVWFVKSLPNILDRLDCVKRSSRLVTIVWIILGPYSFNCKNEILIKINYSFETER